MKGLILYVVVLPVAIYLVARLIDRRYQHRSHRWLLLLACAVFSLSLFLPSPQIDGFDTQFWTHFVGGGIFCGLMWLYYRSVFGRHVWWRELLTIYIVTAALGVLNELYELFAYVFLGGWPVADTSWDLLANTLGGVVFYGMYRLYLFIRR